MPITTSLVRGETLTDRLAADLDGTFPELVRAHQDGIYGGLLRLWHGSSHDAEDIAQEAFLRAYRALRGYEPERIAVLAVRPWLWTIALNVSRNRSRSRSRKPETPLEHTAEPPSAHDVEAEALATANEHVWQRRLGRLPATQRRAVVLRHVAGLPYREIAAALGRPVGTVKADVHRGLARLRSLIDNEETT